MGHDSGHDCLKTEPPSRIQSKLFDPLLIPTLLTLRSCNTNASVTQILKVKYAGPCPTTRQPEHGLFAVDKLRIPGQFIQNEALEHGIFENELQMTGQFVQDEAIEHGLFENEVQIPSQYVPERSV